MTNILIAEIGSVHDGSFGNALNLIHLAKECGANAVKFQYHISKAETSAKAPSPYYFNSETRWDYFNRISFSKDQWLSLYKEAKRIKIKFVVSPFSIEAMNNLKETGVDMIKIASGEVTNLPLIHHIALQKKPVILSTGMSNWYEISKAVKLLKKKHNNLTVVQCSSSYPCPDKEVGINVLSEIKKKYKCEIGFSDHTLGFAASISAVALGATVIEKHLTFHKKMYGSDSPNAMEPNTFKQFAKEIFSAWTIINSPIDKDKISKYKHMKNVFQKSIFLNKSLKKGSLIKYDDLDFKKPGDGISASEYKNVVNKKTVKKLNKDHKLKKVDFI